MGVRYVSGMWIVLVVLSAACCEVAGARYAFFRKLDTRRTGRRVFGGAEAAAGAWGGACALLGRALDARCSCSVLAPRWALTAAHCALPAVAYVQFIGVTRTNNVVAVRLIYSHPDFKAVEEDLGLGMDVVTLRHDIGLVRTRADMLLGGAYAALPPPAARAAGADPAPALAEYDVQELAGKDIDVLGFGVSEGKPSGEALRSVRLQLVACGRAGWLYCACALGVAQGVCSGDSGGPVLYNGTQIGVTSMGPVDCELPAPQPVAMSVFTQLRPYVRLVDDTMRGVDSALRMRVVPQVDDDGARALSDAAKLRASCALVVLLACRWPSQVAIAIRLRERYATKYMD